MTRDIKRAYRILGLRPGASGDDIKRAYRDLAQVWHPDRFGHSDRLQQKAQRNLTRINEAFQILKDYQPPADLDPESIVSTTMGAVLNMGDIMQTGAINRQRVRAASRPSPAGPTGKPSARRRSKVMGLEEWERTGGLKKHAPPRPRRRLWLAAAVLVVIVVVAMVVMAPAARRFLVGP
jgi:curved DNA-binding protein CbpA